MTDQLELIIKTLLLCIAATLFGLQHIIEASRQIKKNTSLSILSRLSAAF